MRSLPGKLKNMLLTVVILICLTTLFPLNALAYQSYCASESYTNPTTGYQAYIFDDAGWLTKTQEASVMETMKSVTEYCNVVFLTNKNNYYELESYSENLCVKTMEQLFGPDKNTIIYLIDNEFDYISAQGDTQYVITSSKARSITDNVYKLSANKQFDQAAIKAFTQINDVLHGRKIAEPMRYFCNAFLAIFAALLINYLYVSKKSKLKRASSVDLVFHTVNTLHYKDSAISGYKEEKIYIPLSSGDGSSGSYHSNGGFHGGGGGHHSGGGGYHSGGHSGGGHRH